MVSVVKKEIEELDCKLDRAAKMVLYGFRSLVFILSRCCEVVCSTGSVTYFDTDVDGHQ